MQAGRCACDCVHTSADDLESQRREPNSLDLQL